MLDNLRRAPSSAFKLLAGIGKNFSPFPWCVIKKNLCAIPDIPSPSMPMKVTLYIYFSNLLIPPFFPASISFLYPTYIYIYLYRELRYFSLRIICRDPVHYVIRSYLHYLHSHLIERLGCWLRKYLVQWGIILHSVIICYLCYYIYIYIYIYAYIL